MEPLPPVRPQEGHGALSHGSLTLSADADRPQPPISSPGLGGLPGCRRTGAGIEQTSRSQFAYPKSEIWLRFAPGVINIESGGEHCPSGEVKMVIPHICILHSRHALIPSGDKPSARLMGRRSTRSGQHHPSRNRHTLLSPANAMPIICAEAMTMIRRAAENGSDVYRGMRHCRFPIFPIRETGASVKLRAPSRSQV